MRAMLERARAGNGDRERPPLALASDSVFERSRGEKGLVGASGGRRKILLGEPGRVLVAGSQSNVALVERKERREAVD